MERHPLKHNLPNQNTCWGITTGLATLAASFTFLAFYFAFFHFSESSPHTVFTQINIAASCTSE